MSKALTIVLILLFSLAQLTSLSKSSGLNIYLFDIFAIVYAFWGIYIMLISKTFEVPRYISGFFIFLAIAMLSLLSAGFWLDTNQLLISGFYIIRFFSYLICAVTIYNLILLNQFSTSFIYRLIVFSGVLLCILGFLQLTFLPDFEVLDASLGWDPHKNRLASSFFDPNFVGAYLSICFALVFDDMFRFGSSAPQKILGTRRYMSYLLIVIFTVSILFTFSRSAWLMFSVIIAVYGVLRARYLLFIGILVAFLAYYAVPRVQTRISGITDPADSAHFRIISWNNTMNIAEDHLLLGVGYNTFRYAQAEYGYIEPGTLGGNSGAGSDSSLLFVFATTGILGLLAYLYAFYKIFVANLLAGSNTNRELVIALVVSLTLESIFINSLFYPQIMLLMFILYSIFSLSEEYIYSDCLK